MDESIEDCRVSLVVTQAETSILVTRPLQTHPVPELATPKVMTDAEPHCVEIPAVNPRLVP